MVTATPKWLDGADPLGGTARNISVQPAPDMYNSPLIASAWFAIKSVSSVGMDRSPLKSLSYTSILL